MRYRVDEAVSGAASGSEAVLLLTAFIGLAVGIILTWAGWRGRQIWLVVWCGGLIVASIAYGAWMLLPAS